MANTNHSGRADLAPMFSNTTMANFACSPFMSTLISSTGGYESMMGDHDSTMRSLQTYKHAVGRVGGECEWKNSKDRSATVGCVVIPTGNHGHPIHR